MESHVFPSGVLSNRLSTMASEYVCFIWDQVVKTSLWTNAELCSHYAISAAMPDELNQLHPTKESVI